MEFCGEKRQEHYTFRNMQISKRVSSNHKVGSILDIILMAFISKNAKMQKVVTRGLLPFQVFWNGK